VSGDSPDAIFSTQRRKGTQRTQSATPSNSAPRQIFKPPTIVDALRQNSGGSQISETTLYSAAKSYAARSQSKQDISDALPRKSRKASIAEDLSIPHALRGESPATLLTF
jgi:hypothetical protein